MGAEDKPIAGDILPMPVDMGDSALDASNKGAERLPASPETSNRQPVIPPTAATVTDIPLARVALPPAASDDTSSQPVQAAAADSSQKSRDDLKKRYDDEARKIIGQYAADPYLETQKIEEVKRNYLRDIYNRNIKLSQT